MKQGLIRRIGNGTTTDIWDTNWIPRVGPMRPIASLVDNPPRLVSQLIDATSATWRYNLIRSTFLPTDAEAILAIPLCTRNIDDFMVLELRKKRGIYCRSAYHMIINTKFHRENWLEENGGPANAATEDKAWRSMWKVKVPSKLKVFCRRLAQHSIPSADVLHHWHMADPSRCTLCGMRDSWRQALLRCTMSHSIWSLADENLVHQLSLNQDCNARNWIFAMQEKLSEKEYLCCLVTVWTIWRA